MRIQEAIKSGKRFRRAGWIESGKVNPDYWTYASRGSFTLLTEDLLAEDWEVERVPVAITRSQFFEAYAHAVGELPSFSSNSALLEMMADRLGL